VAPAETPPTRTVALGLLACSFLALFLELMLIRWVPAALPTVAYYANLLLVTSFFGLGLGALLTGRRSLFGLFPVALLGDVALILLAQRAGIAPGGADEVRFQASAHGGSAVTSSLVLVAVFAANAAVFVPVGQRIGELFGRLPPLRGYAFDLGGSLAGTVAFAIFSHGFFSPIVGAAIPMLLHAALASRRQRVVTGALGLVTLGLMSAATSSSAVWSPYYYITIRDQEGKPGPAEPPPDLRTRQRPPAYSVAVNHTFYQFHGSLDPSRYVAEGGAPVLPHADLYAVPHAVRPGARTTLVLGSGGGLDVEAALLRGSAEVDAVDIDPGLIAIARRWSANGVYDDPRVRVHVDDARAYLERDDRLYDCVTFGYLDSQALSSSMSNVRLDGYVYTVEGLRAGWRRVAPGGLLSVAFYVAGQHWLAERLVHLVRAATGQEPVLYSQGVHLVALVGRGPLHPPETVGAFRRLDGLTPTGEAVTLPTDDWPFLYLRRAGVPRDYLVVLGLLAAAIVGVVLWVRPPGQVEAAEAQSFFLGAGFLLLETKSITDCAIYFGGTWLVTSAVVPGSSSWSWPRTRSRRRAAAGRAGWPSSRRSSSWRSSRARRSWASRPRPGWRGRSSSSRSRSSSPASSSRTCSGPRPARRPSSGPTSSGPRSPACASTAPWPSGAAGCRSWSSRSTGWPGPAPGAASAPPRAPTGSLAA
jgi:hypothetical protein